MAKWHTVRKRDFTMTMKMRKVIFELEIGMGDQARPLPVIWHSKGHGHGRPTAANLERVVVAYGKSLEVGGANEGISRSLGYIPYPTSARIVRAATRELMASWSAGAFQVW